MSNRITVSGKQTKICSICRQSWAGRGTTSSSPGWNTSTKNMSESKTLAYDQGMPRCSFDDVGHRWLTTSKSVDTIERVNSEELMEKHNIRLYGPRVQAEWVVFCLSCFCTTSDIHKFLFNHLLQESDQASQQEWSEKNGHIGGAEYLENQKPEGEK